MRASVKSINVVPGVELSKDRAPEPPSKPREALISRDHEETVSSDESLNSLPGVETSREQAPEHPSKP